MKLVHISNFLILACSWNSCASRRSSRATHSKSISLISRERERIRFALRSYRRWRYVPNAMRRCIYNRTGSTNRFPAGFPCSFIHRFPLLATGRRWRPTDSTSATLASVIFVHDGRPLEAFGIIRRRWSTLQQVNPGVDARIWREALQLFVE
jgi:hypothetical protein